MLKDPAEFIVRGSVEVEWRVMARSPQDAMEYVRREAPDHDEYTGWREITEATQAQPPEGGPFR